MRRKHLHYGHLANSCDIRTVERYFKGPITGMPKKLPENRVYDFLNAVGSCYEDFLYYYHENIGLFGEVSDSGEILNIEPGDRPGGPATVEHIEGKEGAVDDTAFEPRFCGMDNQFDRLRAATLKRINRSLIFFFACIISVIAVVTISSPHSNYIEAFYAEVPVDQKICREETLFKSGIRQLKSEETLHTDDCFAVKLAWRGQGRLYLFSETNERQLVRLFPNRCNFLGYGGVLPNTAGVLTFPLNDLGLPSMFKLDNQVGRETFIALAISPGRLSLKQKQLLDALPDKCDMPYSIPPVALSMKQLLNQTENVWKKGRDWFSIQIRHTF